MWRHSFLVIARSLKSQQATTLISVGGLSTAIWLFFMVMLYVSFESSYDRWHPDADDIYRVEMGGTRLNVGSALYAMVPAPLMPTYAERYDPQAEYTRLIAVVQPQIRSVVSGDYAEAKNVFAADSGMYDVFRFDFVKGDQHSATANPHTIALSEAAARQYFGDENPLGKFMALNFSGVEGRDFVVGGVYRDWPANSHLHPEIILPFEVYAEIYNEGALTNWTNYNYKAYIKIREGGKEAVLEGLNSLYREFGGQDFEKESAPIIAYSLKPVKDIHLSQGVNFEIEPTSNPMYLALFAGFALFVLLVAAVNYLNLALARAFRRAKEVGVRKVAGARKWDLVLHFLVESMALSMLTSVLAFVAVLITLPQMHLFAGKEITLVDIPVPLLLLVLAFPILIGLVAGLYPAVVISSFKPIDMMKGNFSKGTLASNLGTYLITFQFVVTLCLLLASITVSRQLWFMLNADPGYDKENVVVIQLKDRSLKAKPELLKQELRGIPGVQNVTLVSQLPNNVTSWQARIYMTSTGEQELQFHTLETDPHFFEVFGVRAETYDGQPVSQVPSGSYFLNPQARNLFLSLGFTEDDRLLINKTGTDTTRVAGMVEPIHFHSYHQLILPLRIQVRETPPWFNYVCMRIDSESPKEVLSEMTAVLRRMSPTVSHEPRFFDEEVAMAYLYERQTQRIMLVLTLATVVIVCLGVYGLTMLSLQNRVKEIGIRKVLGANTVQLVRLFATKYLLQIVGAATIAVPVTWYAASVWLENYAYRVASSAGISVLAVCAVALLVLVIVGIKAMGTARMNPVQALRSE